jgi:glycosyltransferase involved in cell wall biosynthesis
MKKVAIIGTAGVPARYGGFETLVHHLVNQLENTFKLYVYCSNTFYKKHERKKYFNKTRLFYLPFNANGIQSIMYDIVSIIHAVFYADTLIVLGVSGGIVLPLVKLFTRKKIIVHIDGLEWRRDKWSNVIKKYLKLSEQLAVKFSDADIADNESIKRHTAIHYKTISHLIEYGADHVSKQKLTEADYANYTFLHHPYFFNVCRIEPENNIHIILKSFSLLPTNVVVMVGNWDKSEYGRRLKREYARFSNIFLLNPIYQQHDLDVLRSNCIAYIHGHSAGGTNPSLVEAMYLGLPVIVFDISYNRFTTENKAFYFKNADNLISIVKYNLESDYAVNRKDMEEISHRRYTWSRIASKYSNLISSFDYEYQKNAVESKFSKLKYDLLLKKKLAHLKHPKLFFEEDGGN